MRDKNIFMDIECVQESKQGENTCGDVFISRKVHDEGRLVATLSDGLGSGIKANVLGMLTASMSVNFMLSHEPIERTSKVIMDTLPVCEVRKISYSTFTIVDIASDGETNIIEYDNPKVIIIRNNERFIPEFTTIYIDDNSSKGKKILSTTFKVEKEDRIIILSDGITQSGIGSSTMPFGWGENAVVNFICNIIQKTPDISARTLAQKVVKQATVNDRFCTKDDSSCAVIYFREPRKMLLCSGPPFRKAFDQKIARRFERFNGKKVISGGTTAEIISRELNRKIEVKLKLDKSGLPPVSVMEGANLVSEGIITIGKVAEILDNAATTQVSGEGPAVEIVNMFFDSDEIHFLIGTKINEAHQDPSLPVELEIRRNVFKKIVKLLRDKFLKEVYIEFL